MGFFLSPIKFVFELIGFLLSAAFVYGLALIAAITFIMYGMSTIEKHEVTKFVEKGPELTCTRVTGCELFPNAKTEEEYCPTCVIK